MLADLLRTVEDRCDRAVAIINATVSAVGGEALDLYRDDDVQSLLCASLERLAGELAVLSERALKARITAQGR